MRDETPMQGLGLRLWVAALTLAAAACGNGVPIILRIDTFTSTIDVESTIEKIETGLKTKGLLPPQAAGIPEIWPDSLPHITYVQDLSSAPQAINISPDQAQYAQLFKYQAALQRIELNDLVVRIEQNSSNISLPSMALQAADGVAGNPNGPNPDDPHAWTAIGSLPGADVTPSATPGGPQIPPIKDLQFSFVPGGETYLDGKLSTQGAIQFSLRTRGVFRYDTAVNKYRPHGAMTLRIILVATIFVAPEKL